MAKKRRKDKEVARLRREVEVLRAQLAGQGSVKAKALEEAIEKESIPKKGARLKAKQPLKEITSTRVDTKYIKADLRKSGILTAIALAAVIALTFLL
jgi:hypothetical protein